MITSELRQHIHDTLHFSCSGGVAHNKLLAKLASSMHKPNKQTMVPFAAIPGLMATLPISRLKGFGGKVGKTLNEKFGAETVSDLLKISESALEREFGDT